MDVVNMKQQIGELLNKCFITYSHIVITRMGELPLHRILIKHSKHLEK